MFSVRGYFFAVYCFLTQLVGISHQWLHWSHHLRPISFNFSIAKAIWTLLPVLLSPPGFLLQMCYLDTNLLGVHLCFSVSFLCVPNHQSRSGVAQGFGLSPSIAITCAWFVFIPQPCNSVAWALGKSSQSLNYFSCVFRQALHFGNYHTLGTYSELANEGVRLFTCLWLERCMMK